MSRLIRLTSLLASRSPTAADSTGRSEASVALVWALDPLALLPIRRAEHPKDPWSGQMGLPGGRRGVGDEDLLATAIRETAEEVGVDLSGALNLGALDDLAPVTAVLPPILVRPFVFQVEGRPGLRPNAEIAAARWVELDSLLAPGVYDSFPVEAGGFRIHRQGYALPEGVVWGMTERILTPVLKVLGGN